MVDLLTTQPPSRTDPWKCFQQSQNSAVSFPLDLLEQPGMGLRHLPVPMLYETREENMLLGTNWPMRDARENILILLWYRPFLQRESLSVLDKKLAMCSSGGVGDDFFLSWRIHSPRDSADPEQQLLEMVRTKASELGIMWLPRKTSTPLSPPCRTPAHL